MVLEELGEHELDRDRLFELEVRGGDDDSHASSAEYAVDPIPSTDHVAGLKRVHVDLG